MSTCLRSCKENAQNTIYEFFTHRAQANVVHSPKASPQTFQLHKNVEERRRTPTMRAMVFLLSSSFLPGISPSFSPFSISNVLGQENARPQWTHRYGQEISQLDFHKNPPNSDLHLYPKTGVFGRQNSTTNHKISPGIRC